MFEIKDYASIYKNSELGLDGLIWESKCLAETDFRKSQSYLLKFYFRDKRIFLLSVIRKELVIAQEPDFVVLVEIPFPRFGFRRFPTQQAYKRLLRANIEGIPKNCANNNQDDSTTSYLARQLPVLRRDCRQNPYEKFNRLMNKMTG